MNRILSYGGRMVWTLVAGCDCRVLSVMLLTKTPLRYQRDVNRMVYNDNLGVSTR